MKRLKFTDRLVPLVLSGEKTSTWRLFDDKNLSVGDLLIFTNQKTGEDFAEAEIVSIQEKPLKEIVESDFVGHEKFESTEKMLETYQSYYGNTVNEDTVVKMISFKLLPI